MKKGTRLVSVYGIVAYEHQGYGVELGEERRQHFGFKFPL